MSLSFLEEWGEMREDMPEPCAQHAAVVRLALAMGLRSMVASPRICLDHVWCLSDCEVSCHTMKLEGQPETWLEDP